MPETQKLARRYEDQGLVFIGVHTKKAADRMAEYVKENEIELPLAVDAEEKTVKAYAVDSYPDYYLIDRAGKLRVADLANADLERAVKVLLAEKAPEREKKAEEPAGKSGEGEKKGEDKADG